METPTRREQSFEAEKREISLYEQYKHYYGYGYYIARKATD